MKKKYIQPEITFEPIECEEGINITSTNNEAIGVGNTPGNISDAGEGTGSGVNDDEISNSLDLSF